MYNVLLWLWFIFIVIPLGILRYVVWPLFLFTVFGPLGLLVWIFIH